ncbi:MAG: hypothetical protein L3V56_09910, partial [Candidatus Magnetoovum sp. WYHC-5]|nr:hypothetical protein [Candidatus Magnetoovum sp. WYHC-5]
MKKIRWIIEAVFLAIAVLPFVLLPRKLSLQLGRFLGYLLYLLWGKRRNIAINNISNSFLTLKRGKKTPRQIAKGCFINLGYSFSELARIYYGVGQDIIDSIDVVGIENYHAAKSKGRGVLIITAHGGNWELLALLFSVKIDKSSVVARRQNNPYLNAFV